MTKSVLRGLWLRIRRLPLDNCRSRSRHRSRLHVSPPPPQSQDLLDIVHPTQDVTHDQDMENCENEDDLEWSRLALWDRRNKMGVIKRLSKQRQERRLSVIQTHYCGG